MNLNFVIFGCFLFETRRGPIPSSCQHDERAIPQAACVSCSGVDIGVSATFSWNDSALVSGCAGLLGIGPKCFRLGFELGQHARLLGGEIGRRRAPLLGRLESNYPKSSHGW